ncbi:uncharacterized protein LOC107370984 [Tetranychus urticae]|uniref:uncharacterized protein LOC107370984 n=1 Tax=Tetranychus urticae TaxID=32264 RepID=UPI00077BFF15|nr:uncharacterized protein LOC107370984 [Tetranychus urticae]
MDFTETDNQLTIVNRSKEHRISRKLILEIPYFKKMLRHGFKTSKVNKVFLDFDEQTLESFLDWFELGYTFVEMKNALNMFHMLDCFGIKKNVSNIETYFHNNFTIEHLPIILPQVTSTSKLINSGTLNAFLCRYFAKIANTTVWLDYPIETIEYICKLDLMVHSEKQVFDAIMKWANFKSDSRKCHLERLLNLVRLCHLKATDMTLIEENEFVKSSGFKPIICSSRKLNCDCGRNRTDQNYFIMIERLKDEVLRIKVLDNNLLPLFNRVVESDSLLPSHILPDKYISDIFFGLGEVIRVDWRRNKYKYLSGHHQDSYSEKIFESIYKEDGHQIEDYYYWNGFIEANERCILINFNSQSVRYWPKHTTKDTKISSDKSHFFHATVLGNNIYLLNKKLEFIQSDIYFKKCVTFDTHIDKSIAELCYFILTSKQSNDDRVILIDTISKDARCFNVNTKEWSSINHIIYPSYYSNAEKMEFFRLLTFTSGFLSMDIMRLCSPH